MDLPEHSRKDVDLIERYIDGELSPEIVSFRRKVEDDSEFRNLLESRNEMRDLWIRAKKVEATKAELKRIVHKKDSAKKGKVFILPGFISQNKYYAIAAGLILLIGVISLLMLITNKSTNDAVAHNDKVHSYSVHNPMDQAYKGDKKTYEAANSKIVLLKPDNKALLTSHEQIIFQWTGKGDSLVDFTILQSTNKLIVFTKKVRQGEQSFRLSPGTLKAGKYTWIIGDPLTSRSLIIK
jgi:hypothetical protein